MESEPIKQSQPNEHLSDVQPATGGTTQPALQEVVSKLWEAVRHGADVIVTLRQENAILQSQITSLQRSESGLQARIDELLERIEAFDANAQTPPFPIDRMEDSIMVARIKELEEDLGKAMETRRETTEQLAKVEQALAETSQQLEEHRDVSQQVLQLRSELEMRAHLLQELQEGFTGSETGDGAAYTIQLEEERDRLTAELNRAMEIVQRYRAAGLRHLEEESSQDQLALFMTEAARVSSAEPLNLEQVAERLEAIAKQLDDLAELS